MKKIEELEKSIFPEVNELSIAQDENGDVEIRGFILDEEMDKIECVFYAEGFVRIESEKFSYIDLTQRHLSKLSNLISIATKMYIEHYEQLKQKQ